MKICLISDEISADFETAVELGTEWGIHSFELRGFYTDRVPLFSPYQEEIIQETMQRYNAQIVALSPGLFKMPFPAIRREYLPVRSIDAGFYEANQSLQEQMRLHLNKLLPASIALAKRLGVQKIITFGFHRGGQPYGPVPETLLKTLEEAAKLVGDANMTLCIEPEPEFWTDTGEHTANIIHKVAHPALQVNWDPSNCLLAGDEPQKGYQAVRGLVQHVHFKNISSCDELEFKVEGIIDWETQLNSLREDGYSGYISIETHMQPKIASAQRSLNYLMGLLNKTAS